MKKMNWRFAYDEMSYTECTLFKLNGSITHESMKTAAGNH